MGGKIFPAFLNFYVPHILQSDKARMESFDITKLFNLLDPEKQKFLLSGLLAKQHQDQDRPATEEQTTSLSESVSNKSESEEGVRFTADELLEKVRAGNKETEAQKYFKVCHDFAPINCI